MIDRLYGSLDSFHRSLLKLARAGIPEEGADTELFENNTVRFFKDALVPRAPEAR